MLIVTRSSCARLPGPRRPQSDGPHFAFGTNSQILHLAARRIRRSQRACLPRITDQCTRLRKIHQEPAASPRLPPSFDRSRQGGGSRGTNTPFRQRLDPTHCMARADLLILPLARPRLNSLTRGCAGACPCPSLSVPVLFGARPRTNSKSSRPLQPTFPLPVPTRDHDQSEFSSWHRLGCRCWQGLIPLEKGGPSSGCKPRGHPDGGRNTSIWLR